MKSIKPVFKFINNLLGMQDVVIGEKYRPISFCTVVSENGYSAAFNSLTGELLLLDKKEAELFECETVVAGGETVELIKRWFFVPLVHDDMKIRDEILDFANITLPKKGFGGYTIFSTTDCNARCFYCFELGHGRIDMTDKVANDTADYILKTHADKEISLAWFGGEPLYNDRAIDIITGRLIDAGIKFKSSMVSNAYLFDAERIKKAVERWNLKKIQITLDGTEDVYNRIKAYIYRDGKSPFKVVMDNIDQALKAGIRVSIRLNMDNNNYANLCELVDILHDRFGSAEGFSVYCEQLFELEERPNTIHSDIERVELNRKWLDLMGRIKKCGMLATKPLPNDFKANSCMADSSASVMILPDGHLGKCENFIDSQFIGNIYDGITDHALVDLFTKRADGFEICHGCKAYPLCIRLLKCPMCKVAGICNEAVRSHREQQLYESVRAFVYTYLKNNPQ